MSFNKLRDLFSVRSYQALGLYQVLTGMKNYHLILNTNLWIDGGTVFLGFLFHLVIHMK